MSSAAVAAAAAATATHVTAAVVGISALGHFVKTL